MRNKIMLTIRDALGMGTTLAAKGLQNILDGHELDVSFMAGYVCLKSFAKARSILPGNFRDENGAVIKLAELDDEMVHHIREV